MEAKYESVIGELGCQLELARAGRLRTPAKFAGYMKGEAAHPLYVDLLRAMARIDALSEAIELIANS